ncbi:hypothetical protein [Olleya sp. HaHaR_3_96]|uniref:hypothetical protein n=1 Tax=Olleya sp. HaHaR_3_96 TaxID=2745560 RepID=UPI001C4E720E|nr:hypothetical protein [Olleya sp. HaHaR_3_96]QXP58421.1 hypothetical protein H0I26_10865 [Olleya sp. HaHaR_3_96]
MIENLEKINLDETPLTRQLLENYVLRMYEDEADLSDESLKTELILLKNSNELQQLVLAEALTNLKM